MDGAEINQVITTKKGETISFSTVGNPGGSPLLIYPGLGNHRSLILLLKPFAERYGLNVINIDRPGSGLSNHKEIEPTTNRFQRVISNTLCVLKHLKVIRGSIYLMGQSCGAAYALQVAKELKDKRHNLHVKHLFLISPWISLKKPATNPYLRTIRNLPNVILHSGAQSLMYFISFRLRSIQAEHKMVGTCLPYLTSSVSGLPLYSASASCSTLSITSEDPILSSSSSSSENGEQLPLAYRIAKLEVKEDTGGLVADAMYAMDKGGQKCPDWQEILKEKLNVTVYHGQNDSMVPFQAVIEEFYGTNTAVYLVMQGTHELLFNSQVIMDIFKKVNKGFSENKNTDEITVFGSL